MRLLLSLLTFFTILTPLKEASAASQSKKIKVEVILYFVQIFDSNGNFLTAPFPAPTPMRHVKVILRDIKTNRLIRIGNTDGKGTFTTRLLAGKYTVSLAHDYYASQFCPSHSLSCGDLAVELPGRGESEVVTFSSNKRSVIVHYQEEYGL
jgi:hypothetical protein